MSVLKFKNQETGEWQYINTIQGQPGPKGDTPQKGKDYWTPDDIAEIKADVEAMVGDIDSVLDSIIAKQTEVLGGDS